MAINKTLKKVSTSKEHDKDKEEDQEQEIDMYYPPVELEDNLEIVKEDIEHVYLDDSDDWLDIMDNDPSMNDDTDGDDEY